MAAICSSESGDDFAVSDAESPGGFAVLSFRSSWSDMREAGVIGSCADSGCAVAAGGSYAVVLEEDFASRFLSLPHAASASGTTNEMTSNARTVLMVPPWNPASSRGFDSAERRVQEARS